MQYKGLYKTYTNITSYRQYCPNQDK